jgi:DNA invertase Pin-like site-specific DNA recombinase
MLLGYARVSQDSQDHALQLDALRAAGCDKLFVETASGTRTDRPELAKALEQARQGRAGGLASWLAGEVAPAPHRHRR